MTTSQQDLTGTLAQPTETSFEFKRVFNAPRDRVWAAFTNPTLISQWWGGSTTVEEMELRAGGKWRFVAHYPGHEQTHHGVYQEVTPPERIVTTFVSEGMTYPPHIEMSDFEDRGEKTGFTLTATFDTAEERDTLLKYGAEQGMKQTYARLDELLTTGAFEG